MSIGYTITFSVLEYRQREHFLLSLSKSSTALIMKKRLPVVRFKEIVNIRPTIYVELCSYVNAGILQNKQKIFIRIIPQKKK